jgi:hypothetical protein
MDCAPVCLAISTPWRSDGDLTIVVGDDDGGVHFSGITSVRE